MRLRTYLSAPSIARASIVGTEYRISDNIDLLESSCEVQMAVTGTETQLLDDGTTVVYSQRLSAGEMRKAIIRQIEVLSYISDDPEEVLKRFNVDYGQQA